MKPMVVILLSDKRSGSTIFEDELCKHPDINHVVYTPHSYNETHYWLMAACMLGSSRQLFYGHQRYKSYGSNKQARRLLIDCICGNVLDFKILEDDQTLVFEGWEALCRQFAQPIFFEKSPQHPHHWAALDLMLKWVERTKFNVKFIGLIRNPMAVMYSALELFSTDPFERQFGWAHCYRNILAMKEMVGKERFHLVRYEDLIARPKQIFKEIFEFLELDHCDTIGEKVHGQSVSKWLDDQTFTLQLHESVVRVAMHFGYTEDDLYNPPKPGLTAKEWIRRQVKGTLKLAKARLFNRLIKPFMLSTIRRK